MAIGKKTGGRTKGTPNRATTEIAELLASLDCDPVAGMVQIAMDGQNPVELRGRMLSELAQYLFPKRRATEIKTDSGPRVTFNISNDPLPNPPVPLQ